jgi:mRNA-degrading endonuclease toxin of MazEF toxin-antitoxin module
MYQKGDVVLVSMAERSLDEFQAKRRPAVIVSGKVMDQAMIVPLTSNMARQGSVVLIEMHSFEGKAAGLRLDSCVDCTVVATVPTALIVPKIGQLPKETMTRIDECIRRQLDGDA